MLRAQRHALIGAGAGIGLSAKCAEHAGIDFIVVYNSGRDRMNGHGSMLGGMSFASANTTVLQMARQILPVVQHTPVVAGVCASDPYEHIPRLLQRLKDLGFAGVQNFPSVCLLDGSTRREAEETGYTFAKEVAMIAQARAMDLLTVAYVRTAEECATMTEAGADILVPHVGLTTAGLIGARTAATLDEAVERIRTLYETAAAIRPEVLMLCHGGPIVTPDDAAYVLRALPGLAGFLGASSMERVPVEKALVTTMKAFKKLALPDTSTPARQEATS
ncbi:phosphoenolpyruvate hydrolase family protein [Streptomyces spiralis]|uniref:phosphoenolpyruvate hydrolase family protein n=1 Tax=Streptomyces spiralis TaxID=66376 RepID=UPI0036C931D6